RKEIDQLRLDSLTDPLTKLFNRRAFDAEYEHQLAMARDQRRELGVILVDLDGFKLINDRFGHGEGDQLLIDMANILRVASGAEAPASIRGMRRGRGPYAAPPESGEKRRDALAVRQG